MAVIVPQFGGTDSFARHEYNALVIDTTSEQACLAALARLINDGALRVSLMRQGREGMGRFAPEFSAMRLLERLFRVVKP
jgi:hypothetical protein